MKRHHESLRFSRASKLEAVRFNSTNANDLTTYLGAIGKVITDNNIDPRRLANLDEVGVNPQRDTQCGASFKV